MHLLLTLCLPPVLASGCVLFDYPDFMAAERAYRDCIARYPEMPDICERERTDRDHQYRTYVDDTKPFENLLNKSFSRGNKD